MAFELDKKDQTLLYKDCKEANDGRENVELQRLRGDDIP